MLSNTLNVEPHQNTKIGTDHAFHMHLWTTEIRNVTNSNYALGDERFKTEQFIKRRVRPGKSGWLRKAVAVDG